MSNYPDDIRSYDNDPRSPFYDDRQRCEECGAICDEEDFYTDSEDNSVGVCAYCKHEWMEEY